MIDRLASLLGRLTSMLTLIGAIGIVLMTIVIGWQVFGRYVLNASPAWTEQFALVLMVWLVMFGAAAGVREGFHIRIEAFADALPASARAACRLSALAVVGFCGITLAIWGGHLVIAVWHHVIPTLGVSRGFAYLPLPVSGALIALFAFEKVLCEIQSPDTSNGRGTD